MRRSFALSEFIATQFGQLGFRFAHYPLLLPHFRFRRGICNGEHLYFSSPEQHWLTLQGMDLGAELAVTVHSAASSANTASRRSSLAVICRLYGMFRSLSKWSTKC